MTTQVKYINDSTLEVERVGDFFFGVCKANDRTLLVEAATQQKVVELALAWVENGTPRVLTES